ncbi:MAG: hypothetical protein AAF845_06485 [Bacteroidota bacterium]
MEQYLLTAAAAFVGGAVSALLILPKALADRETHASNRILETRLLALQSIWDQLNEVIWLVSPSMSMGHERWHSEYFDRAHEAALAFKKEAERQQIVLDRSVVRAFVKVYSGFDIYMRGLEVDDRHSQPRSYAWFLKERLNPSLAKVAEAVNETMSVSTHQIALQFTDEAT